VLSNKTGVQFLPLVAQGIAQVVVHLSVTADQERKLREAAQHEGRAGWSSQVLAQHLAKQVVQASKNGAGYRLWLTGERAHLALGPATCEAIAEALESDQIALDAAKEEQAEQGMEFARKLANLIGCISYFGADARAADEARTIALSANEGKDVRRAVLEEVLDIIGRKAGLKAKVEFLRPTQIQSRTPDRITLLAQRALETARDEFHKSLPPELAEGVSLGVVQTVRMPRNGAPWTGLSLQAKLLPNYGPITAVWNMDTSRPGEKS
jgi:hypothetical protein